MLTLPRLRRDNALALGNPCDGVTVSWFSIYT